MMIMTRSLVVSLEPARSRQTCAQIRAQKLKDTGAISLQAFDLAMNRVEVLEDQLASAKFASRLQNTSLLKQKPLSFTSRMRLPVGARLRSVLP